MDEVVDVDVRGGMIERFLVAGDSEDQRLVDFPYCSLLWLHRIAHTGFQTTGYPYELTRSFQSGSCMLATVAGKGKVHIDGEWVVLDAGEVCLLPPYTFNSIQSIEGHEWSFIWVKYLEDLGSQPVVSAVSPVHGRFDPLPLKHAIHGLYDACQSGVCTSAQNLWVELIHKYVLHFAQPKVGDKRLWNLWYAVDQKLGYPWTLSEMADIANLSTEHLRRLCLKQFGKSPKQYLVYLRMRKARYLLGSSDAKITMIAAKLGYVDSQTFTKAFKKHHGISPSAMR